MNSGDLLALRVIDDAAMPQRRDWIRVRLDDGRLLTFVRRGFLEELRNDFCIEDGIPVAMAS